MYIVTLFGKEHIVNTISMLDLYKRALQAKKMFENDKTIIIKSVNKEKLLLNIVDRFHRCTRYTVITTTGEYKFITPERFMITFPNIN